MERNSDGEVVYNESDFEIDIDSIEPDQIFNISNEKNNNTVSN